MGLPQEDKRQVEHPRSWLTLTILTAAWVGAMVGLPIAVVGRAVGLPTAPTVKIPAAGQADPYVPKHWPVAGNEHFVTAVNVAFMIIPVQPAPLNVPESR